MDNLKYYNDSLAYDFNMFMPREKKREETADNIVKLPKPKIKQRRKAATKTVSVTAYAVLVAFIVLAALCGNIFLRLRINEVNSKISDIKASIDLADSEMTSLEVELERRISYSNIEVEATEMGMKKVDKNQVKYIRVNDKNTAKTSDGKVYTAEE